MELNFKLTYNIPEELIKALGINEDSARFLCPDPCYNNCFHRFCD